MWWAAVALAALALGAGPVLSHVGELPVRVPQYAKVGDSPSLVCDYTMGPREQLYSVKWYKDNMEFYRYVPKDSPRKQVFEVTGVKVAVERSDSRQVQLHGVSLGSSGTYMCEVSGEAPQFRTKDGAEDMKVIQPPSSPPSLTQPSGRYRVGDMLEVNCSSGASFPPAKLRYFLNSRMEDGSYTVGHRRKGEDGLIAPSLTLSLRLTRDHFQGDVLRIRCEARIYNMWEKSATGIFPGENLGERALERILAGGAVGPAAPGAALLPLAGGLLTALARHPLLRA